MPGRLGKYTNWQDDVVGQQALDERQSQWGEISGKVVEFDHEKQTAKIQPMFKPRHNGKAIDMPELHEVPMRFHRAGKGAAITYPVAKDDYVTLRPQMRSTQNYHEDEKGEASDARSFSPADYEAHAGGGESLKKPIKNFDKDNMHIRFDEDGKYGIRGHRDGKFKIEGKEGNVYAIIREFMELVADDKLMIKYGSSAGTGHQLENRDKLKKLAQKMKGMEL